VGAAGGGNIGRWLVLVKAKSRPVLGLQGRFPFAAAPREDEVGDIAVERPNTLLLLSCWLEAPKGEPRVPSKPVWLLKS
jgi:hypothetical protein